jgi:CYTH domain-containing protein
VTDGTEIERKFLLAKLPPGVDHARREPIRQGYVALDGDTEVRLRIEPSAATLTIKHGRGVARIEEAIAVDQRVAGALWELTDGRRVEKTRRRVRLDGGVEAEIDEFTGALDGLVTAEVEFPDEDAARDFQPPAWFGREVTADEAFKNRNLATDGLPDDA